MILNAEKTAAAAARVETLATYMEARKNDVDAAMPEQVAEWSAVLGADVVHRELEFVFKAHEDGLRTIAKTVKASPGLQNQIDMALRLIDGSITKRMETLVGRVAATDHSS